MMLVVNSKINSRMVQRKEGDISYERNSDAPVLTVSVVVTRDGRAEVRLWCRCVQQVSSRVRSEEQVRARGIGSW